MKLLTGDPCPHAFADLMLLPHRDAARCRGCGLEFDLDPQTMARAVEAVRRQNEGLNYRGLVDR
jgi:hypothetical protein